MNIIIIMIIIIIQLLLCAIDLVNYSEVQRKRKITDFTEINIYI